MPYLLINLKSENSSIRKSAYETLFGNIWHQGTVYSATAYAVPFLFELLDSASTHDKDWLVVLLASIASGRGYYQVHQPIFAQRDSDTDKHENELKQEEINVHAVRQAISPRFETLLKQLNNKDSEIRLSVAEAAAYYPEYAEKSLLKLKETLEIETDEEVREAIQESISQLLNFTEI